MNIKIKRGEVGKIQLLLCYYCLENKVGTNQGKERARKKTSVEEAGCGGVTAGACELERPLRTKPRDADPVGGLFRDLSQPLPVPTFRAQGLHLMRTACF